MYIVGLGASAGGLEPLGQFLAAVPADSGLAFIVVQHMDPTHRGLLVELLQRVTAMPVCEATDSMRVRPGVVHVIPPNTDLTVAHGLLHLAEPAQPRGLRLPIDVLFSSLARDQGERAIGVVLSGMGADGTLGLMEIKSQGGLTLVQAPESAQFDSMPKSALAAGCVDITALPAEMPAHILRVIAPATASQPPPADDDAPDRDVSTLDAILAHLREQTHHDLSLYKTSTLVRRIERRMAVHGIDSIEAYEESVRENPQELNLLFKEMLIGVTSFFRDPDMWRELQTMVLPALLARQRAEGLALRAWVVGCSTGEEAYSLAILFRELADALPDPSRLTLQIFATDLNEDAIAAARKGWFPASISNVVSPARLARFFTPREDGHLVAQNIREMVLFAQHDAILDPPFTRIDILSCRNLMIYFNSALQRRLLPLFHYCLRPGGTLILGGSETIGRWHSLFTPIQAKSKIYRRCDNAASPVDFPVRRLHSTAVRQEPRVTQSSDRPPNLQAVAEHALLQQFSPPAVLVNAAGDILYINGRTGRYLEPAAGKANWNIHVMAREGIRTQLSVALRTVLKDKSQLELPGLRLTDEPSDTLNITLQALREPRALEGMVMIVFREAVAAPSGEAATRQATNGSEAGLALELQHAREEIRALRDEMQATQEALQAANEELQSTNEELQSANEELTTSKEEAQSMNEELQTINHELQSKLDALALAQSDMQNLLNSTEIATLFLDNDLNVRRFTDQVTRLIQLRDSDIGRPLSDLASVLIYPQLYADVKETLRTLAFCEKQIPTTDGRWYSMRIMPYRTLTNTIQGAVITFVDITAAKELESRLRNN